MPESGRIRASFDLNCANRAITECASLAVCCGIPQPDCAVDAQDRFRLSTPNCGTTDGLCCADGGTAALGGCDYGAWNQCLSNRVVNIVLWSCWRCSLRA